MELDYDWLFAFVVFAEHRSFTHAPAITYHARVRAGFASPATEARRRLIAETAAAA